VRLRTRGDVVVAEPSCGGRYNTANLIISQPRSSPDHPVVKLELELFNSDGELVQRSANTTEQRLTATPALPIWMVTSSALSPHGGRCCKSFPDVPQLFSQVLAARILQDLSQLPVPRALTKQWYKQVTTQQRSRFPAELKPPINLQNGNRKYCAVGICERLTNPRQARTPAVARSAMSVSGSLWPHLSEC
jgi:hypothetical protein